MEVLVNVENFEKTLQILPLSFADLFFGESTRHVATDRHNGSSLHFKRCNQWSRDYFASVFAG